MEYNSPRQRDSLPVRSGEEPDLLVKDIRDPEEFCRFFDAAVDHRTGEITQPQSQGDIVIYVKMLV